MSEHPVKPVERADRAGGERAAAGETAARAWWRRVPRVVTAPRSVFSALAETDDLDVDARSEPVLAITILAGMGAVLLTPAWGSVMDDGSVDGLVLLVVTFVAGLFYGAAGYFLLGLALWLGAKAVGVDQPFKIARQLVAFAALPLALSLVVVVPVIAIAFGDDWFRTGGDDTGTGRGDRRRNRARLRRVVARARGARPANDVQPAVARCRRCAGPRCRDGRRLRRAPERPLGAPPP